MDCKSIFPFLTKAKILFSIITMSLSACGGGGGGSTPASELNQSYSVSGVISIPSFTVLDSDINNSAGTPISNSSFVTAQIVPNPANIGGYVNAPNTGVAGASFTDGDRDDYFKVTLTAGQEVRLTIAEFDTQDLDLTLYKSDQSLYNLVVAGVGVKNQSITIGVGDGGDYFINVSTGSGASSYVLSIGIEETTIVKKSISKQPGLLQLSSDFKHMQLIVKNKDSNSINQVDVSESLQEQLSLAQVNNHSTALPEFSAVNENVNDSGLNSSSTPLTNEEYLEQKIKQGTTLEQQQKLKTLYAVSQLRNRSGIEYAEPNYIRKALVTIPNDPYYSDQWHYPLINLPDAWDITLGKPSVIVAVIDTGVFLTHTDLTGKLTLGYDFISDPGNAGDGDGIDPNPNDEGDGIGGPSSFHGTHVAGTIGANTNNAQGVAGVGWHSSIMPIRVLGKYGGTDYDIAQGILYAAGLDNASGTLPPFKADIINMSLGGGGYSSILASAIVDARSAGVIVVASAGNDGNSIAQYPASLPGVISVSAVDAAKTIAPYSSYGSNIDVAAPGGDLSADITGDGKADGVLSTLANDQGHSLIQYYQGTSMAAPHIAGVFALMKAVNPSLTPSSLDSLLQGGSLTEDIGAIGRDDFYGYGLIDARKAVEAAGGSIGDPAALTVFPLSLNFGFTFDSIDLQVSKTAQKSFTVSSVVANKGWISIANTQVDGEGLGTYTISVDRSSLAEGVHMGEIDIISSSGTTKVEVIIQIISTALTGNVGQSRVVLINKATNLEVARFDSADVSGQYNFDLSAIPAGTYNLIVGTDMDNDGSICDQGEACGGYPTLNNLEDIVIDGNKSGLNFVITFLDLAIITLNRNGTLSDKSMFTNPKIASGEGFKLINP